MTPNMPFIKIHHDRAANPAALVALCPFNAIESDRGRLAITAACRMCRLCIKNGDGVFEYVDDGRTGAVDKSAWRGVAVVAEAVDEHLHPVTFELLGKARELADKINHPVLALVVGHRVRARAQTLLEYGADTVHVYDDPAFEHFRIEPYAAALSDFIAKTNPSSVLVGGTTTGRSLAPRVAARLRTGLTADCTRLDMSPETDLDQIRPAYGGNIMAHINTPRHRPQFATVRYKIFSIPPKSPPKGTVVEHTLNPEHLASAIDIRAMQPKRRERGIEESEVIVVAGRGIKKREDLVLLETLAARLNGQIACTRSLIENGWVDAKRQIGLSGRTVRPKLIVTCGVSGAIQFRAGMDGAEWIVAINTDPAAPIFNIAHVGLHGDLYRIVPGLIEKIDARKSGGNA